MFDALDTHFSVSTGNMTLSVKENMQGAPQSSFNASMYRYIQYIKCTIHYKLHVCT